MHVLLALIGQSEELREHRISVTTEILKEIALRNGFASNVAAKRFTCRGASLLGLSFCSEEGFTRTVNDGPWVLATYGETQGVNPEHLLRRLMSASNGDAANIIAAIEGSFSLMLFNSDSGTAMLSSDFAGQRTLRHAFLGHGHAIASHDFALAAAGAAIGEIDKVSRASIDYIGWSVGERSIFDGISTVPAGRVRFLGPDRHQVDLIATPIVPNAEPFSIDSGIADKMYEYVAAIGNTEDAIVELSAGFDSRATLATVLASRSATSITAFSDGPESSLDVTVAREIARRAGIRFVRLEKPQADSERFRREAAYLSLATNGNVDLSVLATNRPLDLTSQPRLSFCGDGGEIYRGYYYGFRPFNRLRPLPSIEPLRVRTRSCFIART